MALNKVLRLEGNNVYLGESGPDIAAALLADVPYQDLGLTPVQAGIILYLMQETANLGGDDALADECQSLIDRLQPDIQAYDILSGSACALDSFKKGG